MRRRFESGALIEEAQRQTNLEAFDGPSFREGLDILAADLSKQERSEESGVATHDELVRYLANRLKVTDYLRRHPALLDTPVERPLFVFGMPRTGTTLASNLLATDPARRSLLSWEAADPVPPPKGAHLKDDPRALAQLEAERKRLAENPAAGRFYRASAIYPTEDVFPMAQDFKALFWESHGKLPAYREFMFTADMTSAYAYHKRYLQLLQSEAPGVWNLKMPSHALWLPTLLELYPDARLVWAHRDPFTAVGSLCSLIASTHMRYTGRIDREWIGQNYPTYVAEHANRMMDVRDAIGEDRIYDLHYADLIRDPIDAMRRLYDWAGDEFTPEVEGGMRAWLADNPQGKFGKHDYKLAEYGLSEAAVRPLFERYLSRHVVEQEG